MEEKLDAELVEAAYLVPRKLESSKLSKLFDGHVNLSDPRNGNKLARHFQAHA